ncbi:MAG: tRNA (guanine(26)-N(2))-dimethyltransferase [Methanoregulaceae archaeon PtaB.Bin056]|jgi:tRNA (guanine26-N2/guanine27-N2)-dimethyltransferase|nr:MAG: tRNA (guanine(26)-N(2))-dimethyltransferase [Methanoregulaceae archaeon PtaB.Bin056]
MEFIEAKEGKTRFFIPLQDPSHPFPPASATVFYNPKMELSRDATVVLVSLLSPLEYLDAMAASGIRGLRVASECAVPVAINDRDREAVALIRQNTGSLDLPIEVLHSDTNVLLSGRSFDAVDLDPFGSPAPFIDSGIRGSGRYLFVTATDTAPLCGAHKNAGIRRYFAQAMNNEYHAETALRILLGFVVREAVKYDRGIEPLFCFSREHYVRVHVRFLRGAEAADRTVSRMGYILQCRSCLFRSEERGLLPETLLCPCCGGRLLPIGPLWTGALQDRELLERMEASIPEFQLGKETQLLQLVRTCRHEPDISYHYDYHVLSRHFRISPPPIGDVIQFISSQGYAAARAHYSGTAVKTNAPLEVIRDALIDGRR